MKEEEIKQEIFKQEEEIAQLEFNNSIKEIANKDDTEIEKYFKNAKHYIKMIAKGVNNGLILKSNGGLGKSYLVLKTLKEQQVDFEYINGYSTTLSFYEYLHENRDKSVLVFDDFTGVLSNDVGINILKSALWSATSSRTIHYLTTSDKLTVPSKFNLKARVIFCLNKGLGADADSMALQNRALFYELNFSYEEIMKIMTEIAKQPYKDMAKEERMAVIEYLKEITDITTKDLNFRTLIKSFDVFIYSKKYNNSKWKGLIQGLIQSDEDMAVVKELIDTEPTAKRQVDKFCEMTGKGRRTFFYLKQRLKNKSKISAKVHNN